MGDHRDPLLDRERSAPSAQDHRQRLLGPDSAELLAAVDVEEQVAAGVGEGHLLDRSVGREALLAVVPVDDTRDPALRASRSRGRSAAGRRGLG